MNPREEPGPGPGEGRHEDLVHLESDDLDGKPVLPGLVGGFLGGIVGAGYGAACFQGLRITGLLVQESGTPRLTAFAVVAGVLGAVLGAVLDGLDDALAVFSPVAVATACGIAGMIVGWYAASVLPLPILWGPLLGTLEGLLLALLYRACWEILP